MQKTLAQITSDVVRLARIDVNDSTSNGAIITDANDAIGIIASKRNWDELYKSSTVNLALADGDTIYPLSSDVDKVDQVRITTPITYARPLIYVPRRMLLDLIPDKSNNGTSTPSSWYYADPSISSSNVETKNISFDIMPDQAYTVKYTYRRYPPSLVNTTDYPFFDQNYHQIIVTYCVWKYAERSPDVALNPQEWESKWNDGLRELLASYDSKVTLNNPIPGPYVSNTP